MSKEPVAEKKDLLKLTMVTDGGTTTHYLVDWKIVTLGTIQFIEGTPLHWEYQKTTGGAVHLTRRQGWDNAFNPSFVKSFTTMRRTIMIHNSPKDYFEWQKKNKS